jgi:hypothetical protein
MTIRRGRAPTISDDIRRDIAVAVRSLIWPPGGICFYRALTGQYVLNVLLRLPADLGRSIGTACSAARRARSSKLPGLPLSARFSGLLPASAWRKPIGWLGRRRDRPGV